MNYLYIINFINLGQSIEYCYIWFFEIFNKFNVFEFEELKICFVVGIYGNVLVGIELFLVLVEFFCLNYKKNLVVI